MSSLPDVSSVVASGRSVVISMGMESTTPSATVRHIHRNFSIFTWNMNIINDPCGVDDESTDPLVAGEATEQVIKDAAMEG